MLRAACNRSCRMRACLMFQMGLEHSSDLIEADKLPENAQAVRPVSILAVWQVRKDRLQTLTQADPVDGCTAYNVAPESQQGFSACPNKGQVGQMDSRPFASMTQPAAARINLAHPATVCRFLGCLQQSQCGQMRLNPRKYTHSQHARVTKMQRGYTPL